VERVDVLLHAGTGKTGTSSIQFFLRDNRDVLASQGVLYPTSPGRGRHVRVGLAVKSDAELERSPGWFRQRESDPAVFRGRVRRRLEREVLASGLSRVLLSDEAVFGSSVPALERLGQWMSSLSRSLVVLVYLRRQDDHLVSRYQQQVKVGATQRLEEWSRRDMSGFYDYHLRLSRLRDLLGPTELRVRPFERGGFVDGSLLQDFLDTAGVEARADRMRQVAEVNVSLDAESVEFLRMLNLHRVAEGSATPGLIDNRDVVSRLAEVSSGPLLTLPGPALDRFMGRWETANELVAREFLGDPSGTLFRASRREVETTTEQSLDPARVDHFVAVAGLPEELRGPLRDLAARAATPRRSTA
jgi:hypothetical protein